MVEKWLYYLYYLYYHHRVDIVVGCVHAEGPIESKAFNREPSKYHSESDFGWPILFVLCAEDFCLCCDDGFCLLFR